MTVNKIVWKEEVMVSINRVTINKRVSMMEALIQQVKVVSKMIAMKLMKTMNLKRTSPKIMNKAILNKVMKANKVAVNIIVMEKVLMMMNITIYKKEVMEEVVMGRNKKILNKVMKAIK